MTLLLVLLAVALGWTLLAASLALLIGRVVAHRDTQRPTETLETPR